MNLAESPEDTAFRQEVREFMNANLTPELRRAGERMVSIFSDFDCSMQWLAILHSRGWAAPDWPVEYGGPGWSLAQRNIFREESVLANAPPPFGLSLQMLGPMLIRYGSEQQKREVLPRILSGEDRWCQGYSEPGSGSDLASLQLQARRDGDCYVLNGSKIWTSYAHRCNKLFCLVRTSNEGPPQRGISFLLLELDTPGIEIAPIVGNDGHVEQCQVFFNDVRVPIVNRVGEENQGWEIAKYLLEFERGSYSYYIVLGKQLKLLRAIQSTANDSAESGSFALRAAELEIDALAVEYTEHRLRSNLSAGKALGVMSSLIKVSATELSQKIDELLLEARGIYACVWQNEVLSPQYTGMPIGPERGITVANAYINNRASTIYGGSAQVQRNIIARKVLGL